MRSPPLLTTTVSAATLACATLMAPVALGQELLLDGTLGIATGLEGGDPGTGSVQWQRARSRVFTGVSFRVDETENEGYDARAFVEMGLQGSTNEAQAGTLAEVALASRGGPGADWIRWALRSYAFTEGTRKRLEARLK